MAIGTFSELKTAIATWTVRTDLDSRIADIVLLAEADIRKDVRCQAMETLAAGTLSGDTLDFPTGFIWAKRLKVGSYVHDYVTQGEYFDLDEVDSEKRFFTIIGQKFYIPGAGSGDSYSLIYYKAFDAFSGDSDTNWLLQNHPDLYLWAGCKAVAIVTDDDKALGRWAALYQGALSKVNRNEWMSGYAGPLEVRSR